MKKKITRTLLLISILFIASCANRGQGPRGGAKDELPPKYLHSIPRQKEKNVKRKMIEIEFDEIVNLKDIANNIIISPPQHKQPNIHSYMRRVVVPLEDTLQSNTTYSIDFGQAITDNNEGNVLESFVLTFSTGNELDTMQISGTVLNAEDLNPVKGLTVGVYADLSDTALLKKPFLRMAKTNDKGEFTIQSLKDGVYKVYALDDNNRNHYYQRGEGMAFDTLHHQTSKENYIHQDTIWEDSLHIDTIVSLEAIRYLPNNIILRYFQDHNKRQYLVKADREMPHKLTLYFNTSAQTPPIIKGLSEGGINTSQILPQPNTTNDTIHYWLTDSVMIQKDTITLQINYLKTDTLFELKPQTDTIHFINKNRRKKGENTHQPFTPKHNLSSSFHPNEDILLQFETPVKRIDTSMIHLLEVIDTISKTPITYRYKKNDSIGLEYSIHHKWKPEKDYELNIDSAAITDLYGRSNVALKQKMKIRANETYATLTLSLAQYDSTAVYQIVDKEDVVIKTVPIKGVDTEIKYLEAGEYYIRIFIDKNRNGAWDSGNIQEKRLPEPMYYYPKKLILIKNWEFKEKIDLYSLPLNRQKPNELKKTLDGKGQKI